MRKIILFPLFLLGVLIVSPSCKKESHDKMVLSVPDETVNVKIAPNQSYKMDLADAGTVIISRQATHFLVSEAGVNNESNTLAYKYIPATDFTGNDEVVLLSTKTVTGNYANNSGGCSGGNNGAASFVSNKYIRLIITVSN
jgi:hypothetical protein